MPEGIEPDTEPTPSAEQAAPPTEQHTEIAVDSPVEKKPEEATLELSPTQIEPEVKYVEEKIKEESKTEIDVPEEGKEEN
jgi:hypothetical protein